MKISVLICTRNRPQDIVWALPSVLKNTYTDYEVIIIDQSEGDETGMIVRPYLATHDNLNYVPSDTRGLSAARNLAMSLATGEVIAFTDDDCETDTNWVDNIAQLYTTEQNTDMVFGQVHMPPDLPNGDMSVPCLYFSERRVLSGNEIFGMGANMSFRRSLLEKISGYDNVLGPGAPLACADDFDFSYRAQLAGARVVTDPSIILIHRAHRDREQWKRVSYLYGIGDAAFYTKHARCGDAWARKRLIGQLLKCLGRTVVRTLQRRDNNAGYLMGFWQGILRSRHYAIDYRSRLYVETPHTS